jgi:hypothetical protein
MASKASATQRRASMKRKGNGRSKRAPTRPMVERHPMDADNSESISSARACAPEARI